MVYNVCTGTPTSVGRLAELLAALLQMTLQIRFAPPRPGDIRRSVGAPDCAREGLGVTAEITVTDGLRALFAAAAAF